MPALIERGRNFSKLAAVAAAALRREITPQQMR
jgi:hypothetical protein